MDSDSIEAFEQMRETLGGVYGPVLFQTKKYAEDERGLGLPPEETLEHLWDLFGTSMDFCYLLASNQTLLDRFKQGMSTNSPAPSPAMSEVDRVIEAALLNHAEFAARQMSRVMRVMRCEPYVRESTDAKEEVLYGSYVELSEAGENLRRWGSEATLDEYNETMELEDEAIEFARTLGINL
jgi:hypothetical protein